MELLNPSDFEPILKFRVPTIWNHLEPEPRVPRGFTIARCSLLPVEQNCERSDRIGAICVAHGLGRLVVSIGCGPLLCFALATGELDWSMESPSGSHHLNIGICSERRTCYALQWSYEHGGSESLLAVDLSNGSVVAEHVVPGWGWSSGQFVKDAEAVVCGGGELETRTRKIREFM